MTVQKVCERKKKMKLLSARQKFFVSDLLPEREELAALREGGGSGSGHSEDLVKEERGDITIYRRSGKDTFNDAVTIKLTGDLSYICGEELDRLVSLVAGELRSIISRSVTLPKEDACVLFAGLGNRAISSDAQGPFAAEKIDATYHLKEAAPDLYRILGSFGRVVIAPGTEGQTGLDPLDVLLGIVSCAKPDLVVVADALAAGCDEYLGRTVQLSSSGITPGSGIGNKKKEISRRTLGIPVFAIGVPTVISSSTLIVNAFERAGYEDIPDALEPILENGRSFFVSPKNSDLLTNGAAELIARVFDSVF